MYPDLPIHLQTLNTLPSSSSPPSSAWNQDQEENLWSFLRTDDIFPSLNAHQPEPLGQGMVEAKKVDVSPSTKESPPTVNDNSPLHGINAPTLESFLATFANSSVPPPSLPTNYLLPLPVPFNGVVTPAATAPTPAATGINTADVMQFPSSSTWGGSEYGDEGSVSGAKRLKKMGAGVAEIEEDKRRRNTEASARFRLKKKEREQALERRAKELEGQVATLVSEKSALASENKLLKYLLLKTGNSGPEAGEGLQEVLEGLGKRKRE